jgi:hypothetical protein
VQRLGVILRRSPRLRQAAARRAAEQISQDPERLAELIGQAGGRDAQRKLEAVIGGRSEAERAELLKTMLAEAEAGKAPSQQMLAAPRKVSGQTKQKRRARNKAARAARRRKR